MAQAVLGSPAAAKAGALDLDARRGIALDRTRELIAQSQARARQAWRWYYGLQVLTIALAAITPCLIFLAKDNPENEVLNWLQLFFPALAAVCAGWSHIVHWREDGVRSTQLSEALRSELWRFQTRTGECPPTFTEEQALDYLVTHVDALNLRAVTQWSADHLATRDAGGVPPTSPPGERRSTSADGPPPG